MRTVVMAGMTLSAAGVALADADDVTVRIENLRNGNGSVLVAICPSEAFLSSDCPYRARADARAGAAEVIVRHVPSGRYAVQAIHDENDNSELDRTLFGMPLEGLGFSRDAPFRYGRPRFSDAAVQISDDDSSVTLSMRYY